VKKVAIKKLFESFEELEKAITSARRTLAKKKSLDPELLCRIEVYENILRKQRMLAADLCGHVAVENWSEVSRHIQLINGLSSMIRDDAREVLTGLRPTLSTEEKEMFLC